MRNRLIVMMIAIGVLLTSAPVEAQRKERISYVPSLDYKTFVLKEAVRKAKKRERAITHLRNLLPLFPEGQEKAQLRFRLADLYLQKSRYLFFMGMAASDPTIVKKNKELKAALKSITDKNGKIEKSAKYNRRAIEICRWILKRYPRIPNRDEVMFYLGYNLNELGKNKEAKRVYAQLIRQFPKSKLIADTYFVQGEYHFQNDGFRQAYNLYRKVLKYPRSSFYDLSQYKMAWCLFNLGSVAKAMRTLEKIIDRSRSKKVGADVAGESVWDLVTMFSYRGDPNEARFYFKRVGGKDKYRDMMRRLAKLYDDQGKNAYAKATYAWLIKDDPDDRENPKYQQRIVALAEAQGKKGEVIKQASKLVRLYGDQSKWTKLNRYNWEALQKAQELSENTLRKIALSFHNEAQKTKDDRTYNLASAAYSEYLQYFPNTKDAYRIRFYYAEALYKLRKLEPAALEYSKVVLMNPKGKLSLAASYNAILAYDELANKAGSSKEKKAKGDSTTAQFIPIWERELARSCDTFVKFFPKDKRAPQIGFKAAKIYYDRNNFQEAVKRFDTIIALYPTSATSKFAINLVLDSWNLQKKWDKVVEWGKKYYANKRITDKRLRRDVYRIIEKASFKVCQTKEAEGKHIEAADSYMAFAKEFNKSRFMDEAINNAGVNYRRGKDLFKSIYAYRVLVERFPRSPYVKNALLSLGKGHEDLAEFGKAADYYETYQRRYSKSKDAADLIYNAGVFRENLNQYNKALKNYRIYVSKYPRRKDTAVVNYGIGLVLEKAGRWKEAANHFRRVGNIYKKNTDVRFAAKAKYGLALEKAGEKAKARTVWKQTMASYRKSGRKATSADTKDLIAEVDFKLLEASHARFKRVKLTMPLSRFASSLQRKARQLDGLMKGYKRVIKHGSPEWGVASYFKLGEAFEDFALGLQRVPDPKGLSPEELAQFRQDLDNRANQMKEEAIAAFTRCMSEASENEIFGKWVTKAGEHLANLYPAARRQLKELIAEPDFAEDGMETGGGF